MPTNALLDSLEEGDLGDLDTFRSSDAKARLFVGVALILNCEGVVGTRVQR